MRVIVWVLLNIPWMLVVRSFVVTPNGRRLPHHPSLLLRAAEESEYDLAIIGAGPVGVQAALAAASAPFDKKVCIIDAPRASGMLMNEETGEDLSLGGPTGLFGKALRDTSKRISVTSLRGMGLREDRYISGLDTVRAENP